MRDLGKEKNGKYEIETYWTLQLSQSNQNNVHFDKKNPLYTFNYVHVQNKIYFRMLFIYELQWRESW